MSDNLFERPVLAHIRDFARSRRVCPESTLAAVLVRANCMIPPHVTVPPIVGGRTSLNLFAALVGPSGYGKGGSESAGRDAIEFVGATVPQPLLELNPGSGEGLAKTFQVTGDENVVHTALFTAPEVDTLSALMGRQGSTLEGELRKVFAGESLGFTNAQKHTRTHVPRLSYRAGLVVGVQPRRAGPLLNGADGGTPQRFVWASVLDRDMPEVAPECPGVLEVKVPPFPSRPDGGFVDLYVPDEPREAIDSHQLAMHRGDIEVDPLAGHALLTRLKVAAALMLLDERARMDEEDWRLAGRIMLRSDATRVAVQREMAAKARGDNRARAWAADERDEFASDRKLIRCKQGIIRWLDRLRDGEHLARRDLSPKLKAELRPYFDAAVAELVDDGAIVVVPLDRGTGYRRFSGTAEVQPTSPAQTCAVPTLDAVPHNGRFARAMSVVHQLNSEISADRLDTLAPATDTYGTSAAESANA